MLLSASARCRSFSANIYPQDYPNINARSRHRPGAAILLLPNVRIGSPSWPDLPRLSGADYYFSECLRQGNKQRLWEAITLDSTAAGLEQERLRLDRAPTAPTRLRAVDPSVSTTMGKGRLILFSGLGGDGRLFRHIRLPDIDVITPDHVDPLAGETLSEYAGRIRVIHGLEPGDIIGGASFGGMIAAEISTQQAVAGLVLLGTCLDPKKLPLLHRLIAWASPLVPNAILGLRSWSPLVRWQFAPLSPEAEECMVEMAADFPPSQLRAFARMVATWAGVDKLTCPVVSIHGDMDRIIPLSAGKPGVVLKNAGHSFTLTHVEDTIAEIQAFCVLTSGTAGRGT